MSDAEEPMPEKRFVKGFKISRDKVAKTFKFDSRSDSRVDDTIRIIVDGLNRESYLYLGLAYDAPLPPGATWKLCNVIVMDHGTDKEALEEKPFNLELVDESIKQALPHVLEGPGVWECA